MEHLRWIRRSIPCGKIAIGSDRDPNEKRDFTLMIEKRKKERKRKEKIKIFRRIFLCFLREKWMVFFFFLFEISRVKISRDNFCSFFLPPFLFSIFPHYRFISSRNHLSLPSFVSLPTYQLIVMNIIRYSKFEQSCSREIIFIFKFPFVIHRLFAAH